MVSGYAGLLFGWVMCVWIYVGCAESHGRAAAAGVEEVEPKTRPRGRTCCRWLLLNSVGRTAFSQAEPPTALRWHPHHIWMTALNIGALWTTGFGCACALRFIWDVPLFGTERGNIASHRLISRQSGCCTYTIHMRDARVQIRLISLVVLRVLSIWQGKISI